MSETRVAHDPAALDLEWDDSHRGAMALLPTGPVWPRDPTEVLSRTVRGLTGVHWRAWRRVRDMLDEADPRTCWETIRMWEIDCGLPDPCVENPPTSLEARRAAVIAKRQMGSITRPVDFIRLGEMLGYEIEVVEFRPYRAWSNCDDALNTAPDWPHTWMVRFLNADRAIWWFRANSGCTEFLRSWSCGDLECIISRIAHAQTLVIFAYELTLPNGDGGP